MNIYADRGNLLLLERRCALARNRLQGDAAGLGDAVDPDAHDLFYLGGGQDRDQRLCAQDLVADQARRLHAAAARGAICSASAADISCSATLRARRRGDPRRRAGRPRDGALGRPRLIGNVAIEVELDGDGRRRVLAGFENHAGRTHLGAAAQPLGRVAQGSRQHGRLRGRGRAPRRRDRHLPARPAAAQERVVRRLADPRGAGARAGELAPLDDRLEDAAHAEARRAAGV